MKRGIAEKAVPFLHSRKEKPSPLGGKVSAKQNVPNFHRCRAGTSPMSTPACGKAQTMLPNDPVMLLSYINTHLRDDYESLDDLCSSLDLDKETLCEKLGEIGYTYREETNSFS